MCESTTTTTTSVVTLGQQYHIGEKTTGILYTDIITMYVCVYVVIPFILDVRLVDAPAGVTQEEDHTGFRHLPSAVLAFIFIARIFSHSIPSSTVNSDFVYPRFDCPSLVLF